MGLFAFRMQEFKSFLPIDPLPCPRPRVAVIRGHGVAYYPAAYKNWVKEFVELFTDKSIEKFSGPVVVNLGFWCRKARTSKLVIPGGDIDNYTKSVLDGLTKIGMWDDDKQVVQLTAVKAWAIPDAAVDNVGIHVQVTNIT